MPAPLIDFAAANDAAAATTKKLAKTAILADYLRNLVIDDDLRRAVRYAAGRPFPATVERNLNVGGAAVGDVALPLLRAGAAGVPRPGRQGRRGRRGHVACLGPPQGAQAAAAAADVGGCFGCV